MILQDKVDRKFDHVAIGVDTWVWRHFMRVWLIKASVLKQTGRVTCSHISFHVRLMTTCDQWLKYIKEESRFAFFGSLQVHLSTYLHPSHHLMAAPGENGPQAHAVHSRHRDDALQLGPRKKAYDLPSFPVSESILHSSPVVLLILSLVMAVTLVAQCTRCVTSKRY
jgi:hypothetical protein